MIGEISINMANFLIVQHDLGIKVLVNNIKVLSMKENVYVSYVMDSIIIHGGMDISSFYTKKKESINGG